MLARRFNRWWLATFLGLCALQVLIAVVADPYCVLGIVRYPKRNFEPNTRYLKVEYLRRHPEYDAFILGSSRASFLESESARAACGPGRRYFNLNASLENGVGIRQKLDWLTRTRTVAQVIIAVDFDLQSVPGDPLDLLRQDHPLISGAAYTGFYAKYLLFQPRILAVYLHGQFRVTSFDPWNRGNRHLAEALYVAAPPFDGVRLFDTTVGAVATDLAGKTSLPRRASDTGTGEFRRSIEILEQRHIERILFVPPYRLDQYASFSIEAYTEWLRKTVADAGQIWDFSGYNAVTPDPRNYDDPLHFNEAVGDRVLQRACGTVPDDAGGDFGVRVTSENIAAHVAGHRIQHAAARAAVARRQAAGPGHARAR